MNNLEKFVILDLEDYYNADAITFDHNRKDGAFGISSFPAEELPESNQRVEVEGIPFIFPSKEDGRKNNIEAFNQQITVPPGNYSNIYILGGCDNGHFCEKIEVIYVEEKSIFKVGLSDWVKNQPVYGEYPAFCCSHLHVVDKDIPGILPKIWLQSIEVDVTNTMSKLVLPDNPCFHIFAITLKRGIV